MKVVPGGIYTLTTAFLTAVTQRVVNLMVRWFDSAGAFISSENSNFSGDATNLWNYAQLAPTAPAPTTVTFISTYLFVFNGDMEPCGFHIFLFIVF